MKRQARFDPLLLSFAVALWLAATGNVAFFRRLVALAPAEASLPLGFLATTAAILVLALGGLLALFALPYVWKPVAIGLLLASAVCAHFMDRYGVVIDRGMVQNVLETDAAEAGDLITGSLVLRVLMLGVLPALAVALAPLEWRPWRREAIRRAALAAVGAAAIAGGIALHYKEFALIGRSHGELRLLVNPTSPLWAAYRQLRGRTERLVVTRIGEDATLRVRASGRPVLVVLVIGETARAASFSLGGYARETNPRLANLPVTYFSSVSACGTSTAVSVPCMFSPFGRERYSDRKAKSHEGLLDVAQRAGVEVLWRDNNSGCKGACDRVPKLAGADLRDPALCDGERCFDEVLLQGLPAWIGELAGDGLVVLHAQGSHGPAYAERSPGAFKKFLPECASSAVERCSREEIVNAYDNTILYTDFVLSRLIGLLEDASRRFDIAMLYVSDHGESLGEDGLYLHGLPRLLAPSEQTHVPMLLWLSDGFRANRGIDGACLAQRADEDASHDHLFHTVLGLLDVSTRLYQPTLDLLEPCRTPAARQLTSH